MKKFLILMLAVMFISLNACHTGSPPKYEKKAKQEQVVQANYQIQMAHVVEQNAEQVYFVRNVSEVPDMSAENKTNDGKAEFGQLNENDYYTVKNSRLASDEQTRLPIIRAVYNADQSSGDAKYYLTQAVDSTGNQEGGGSWSWATDNWVALLFGFMAFVKIIVNLTPTDKDNKIFAWFDTILNAIFPNRKTGGGTHTST